MLPEHVARQAARAVRRGVRPTVPGCPLPPVASCRSATFRQAAPGQLGERLHQLGQHNRLAEQAVHAGLPAQRLVLRRHVGGQRDDRHGPGRRRHGTYPAGNVETAHAGHEDIHEHQVVRSAGNRLERFAAVDRDIDQVALASQQGRGDKLVGQDVLHQQDTGARQDAADRQVRILGLLDVGQRRDRQPHPELIAGMAILGHPRVAADLAPHQRHELAADCQSEAGTERSICARVDAVQVRRRPEQPVPAGLLDHWPAVAHRDMQHRPAACVLLARGQHADGTGLTEFYRVGHQVYQHLA